MSHQVNECYNSYVEQFPKALKSHECDACHRIIRKGDKYCRVYILFQGEKQTVKRCLGCQAIHVHLRSLDPGEMWPAEKLDCGEEYEEHWGGPPPEEVAEIAFLSPEEVQARFGYLADPNRRMSMGLRKAEDNV